MEEITEKNYTDQETSEQQTEEFTEEMANEDKKFGFANFMKRLRGVSARSVAVVCSVVLIGTAVVLNFTLFGGKKPAVSEGEPLSSGTDADLEASEDKANAYFASAQLSRKQARDQAIAVLQTVVESTSAEAVAREQASDDISRIASEIQTEANIETLIRSKGFEKCVAVISEGTASVIVQSDGLLPNELSQIKEIVWEQAGIDPVNIKIIEKKSV